ncbi:nitrite reductase (NO-forming) [Flammeovirgaceae bacterium 311]|nr:nitrite reductase (NO-forming) [Flammeovirgaceae bacterium 311]
MKFKQYWTHGRMLYKKHCIGCHQNDGSGLAQLIPPLAGADFLENRERVVCVIKHGQQGEVVVNGITYNGVMPASPQLQALDIAEIATYILNSWGNEGGFLGVQEAEAMLKNCKEKE